MRAGAALLLGRHDFTQFSNNSPERLRRNPVKNLERLDIIEDDPAAVRLEVSDESLMTSACFLIMLICLWHSCYSHQQFL
jgi:tRNA U38,U39,U40 pseudouridine synthase TruA